VQAFVQQAVVQATVLVATVQAIVMGIVRLVVAFLTSSPSLSLATHASIARPSD
jgi:hypothetical protein